MSNKLDQIQIPVPCPAGWEDMAGDDRIRYCSECKKNVYNLSKMTRLEAEALIETKRGGLCAIIVRNPDGTILTETLPASLPADGRRASPVAAALVTAVIGLSPNIIARPSSMTHNQPPGYALKVEEGSSSLKADADGLAAIQQQETTVQQGEQRQTDLPVINGPVRLSGVVATPVFPLRRLYDTSELVVVARASKSVRVEAQGEARLMKTRLLISSTHKGDQGARAIDLYHLVYGEEDEIYSRGRDLLLFLKRRQGGQKGSKQGYELIDVRHGVRELPEVALQVYLQRIDELAGITSKGEAEREEIVEWLVRCAEHPATRWEGVYDLSVNAETLAEEPVDESMSEDGDEVVEEESTEEEEVTEEVTEDEPDDEDTDMELFARLLTAAQKERLSQALFNIQTITEADFQLIDLVQRWDDGRLVLFLLSQLRQMEANPPRVAAGIIDVIANRLGDESVMQAYGQYTENVSYEDEDEDESEDVAAGSVGRAEARQRRADMLREFITLVESKVKK